MRQFHGTSSDSQQLESMNKLNTQIENGSQNVDDSTVKLISSTYETTEITPGQLIDEYEIAPESDTIELNLAVLPNVRV